MAAVVVVVVGICILCIVYIYTGLCACGNIHWETHSLNHEDSFAKSSQSNYGTPIGPKIPRSTRRPASAPDRCPGDSW